MEVEFQMVRRIRIDFNLIPINGVTSSYPSSEIKTQIIQKVKQLITTVDHNHDNNDNDDNTSPSINVNICQGIPHDFDSEGNMFLVYRPEIGPEVYEKQLKKGDSGFVIIRDGLGFVNRYEGNTWVEKCNNARRFIVQELNCTFYYTRKGPHKLLLLSRVNPCEDARQFVNLLSSSSSTPRPTVVISRLCYWYQLPVLDFVEATLAKLIRDVYIHDKSNNYDVFIEFKNYKACYKGLQKLCSHSLKTKDGNGEVIDYELSLEKRDPTHEVLVYKYNGFDESATLDALDNQVTMLDKVLSTLKVIIQESDGKRRCYCRDTSEGKALKYRLAMVEKRLNTVKDVLLEEFGAECNESSPATLSRLRSRVSELENELNDVKVMMEDYNKSPTTKALENRMAMLEKELNAVKAIVKESSGAYNGSPAVDQARSSKRLRRGWKLL